MYTFDLRNALVPFSLLDLRHRFKEMRSGESMVVLWGDADAADDLLRILPSKSFDIISQAEIPGSPSGFRMELIKK
jgi:TusA-related sulfurtransferase